MTPTAFAAAMLAALIAVLPRIPQPQRGRIEQRHDTIVQRAATSAETYRVPVGVLLAVAFNESHLGTDNSSRVGQGDENWGAPSSRLHRHTAGTSDHAAAALARSFEVCGTWARAVARFRSGLCVPISPIHAAYVRRVMALVARTYAQAQQPLPADLGTPPRVRPTSVAARTP